MNQPKICRVCKEPKALSEFGKSKKTKDGLYTICKICKNAYQRNNYHVGPSEQHLTAKQKRLDLLEKGLQRCACCKEVKQATSEFFRPQKQSLSGLKSHCRACENKRSDRYDKEHPEKAKKRNDKYRIVHIDRRRASFRDYYARNTETQKRRSRDYRLQNPAKVKEGYINWKSLNRDKVAESNGRWRKRVFDAEGQYSSEDLRHLYDEQDGLCGYCGIRIYWAIKRDVTVDHIIPISRNGTNNADNLILCCLHCNCSKNNKTLQEWMITRGW